jgi:hypothetical protein
MSCQTPVIRRGSEAQGGGKGTPSPSFEMPDEVGPYKRLTGDSIPRRVKPSRVRLAVSKLAQSPLLLEPRLVRAPISAARYERTDLW